MEKIYISVGKSKIIDNAVYTARNCDDKADIARHLAKPCTFCCFNGMRVDNDVECNPNNNYLECMANNRLDKSSVYFTKVEL